MGQTQSKKNKKNNNLNEKLIKDKLLTIDNKNIYCYKCNKKFKEKKYFEHLKKCNETLLEENNKL